jgi:hypothetical protein
MLLPFFEWCETTFIGRAISDSVWLFGAIEAVHLLGLCLLGGVVLIVDLRMLGFGLKAQPISEVARQTRRWLVIAVLVMVSTGVPLFLSEAVKCYYNPSFWVKITTLPVALVYTFAVRRRIAADPALVTSARSRLASLASLALWFTVAAAGRWIGFSS